MAFPGAQDEFFTYEGRLASFQNAHPLPKRRASNASSKGPKSLKWPHTFLSPQEMARAGFYHSPSLESPDNTVCFLCQKSIDGWEDGDVPHSEHLKHSSNCGWAIVASIAEQDAELCQEYPLSVKMIEARMATFGERWPHDGKKGWKCKTKQLVDAGWKYTPTPESDDMATCAYCELALDGWETGDKPMDEHHKRSPACPFFALITEHKQMPPPKKTAKGRKPRASKASRLSTQSTFTTMSDAPSFMDVTAEEGDSIMTTATNATVISKSGKARKPAAKGRKAKAKKEEPVEAEQTPEPEDDDFSVKVELPKATKGRKRASEAMDESTLIASQPPAAKRRVTRTKESIAVHESVTVPTVDREADATMADPIETLQPKKTRKTRGSTTKSIRNVSSASTASKASLRMHDLEDDEIDRMLEADLERPLTDDEDGEMESKLEKASKAPIRKPTRASKVAKDDHAMFGIQAPEIDDAAIEAELDAMHMEESKPLPKAKGAKGKQTRKPSAKQLAAAQKAAEAEAETRAQYEIVLQAETQPQPKRQPGGVRASAISVAESMSTAADNEDSGNETDASMASQSTIVRAGNSRRGSTLKKGKAAKGKRVVSRNIEEIVNKSASEQASVEAAPKKQAGRSKKAAQVEEPKPEKLITYPSLIAVEPILPPTRPAPRTQPQAQPSRPLPAPPATIAPPLSQPKLTPIRSSQTLTPTPSPQSSDAENHPPSSKVLSSMKAKGRSTLHSSGSRAPLATASTPAQGYNGPMTLSPSKRSNTVQGLQSSTPWTAINLDSVLLSATATGNENENRDLVLGTRIGGVDEKGFDILKEIDPQGKVMKGELTSPEKKMSVEEWILFNASLAEERLRGQCEALVGVFEREGVRAVGILEGVECEI